MNTITDTTTGTLAKQRDIQRTIVNSILLLAFATLALISSSIAPNTDSWLYLTLITVGVVGVGVVIALILFSCKSLLYTPTKSPVKQYSLFFKTDELSNLMYSIETNNMDGMSKLVGDRNSGIRLDVAISKDRKFAACQIMKYVPYNYEATSVVYTIPVEYVSRFSKLVAELCAKQQT